MKKFFLILAISLCTFCTKRDTKIPKNIYPVEQVAIFLKDLYLMEQKIKDLKLDDDSAKVIFDHYENQLYEKHNMNDSVYRKSFEYYMDDITSLSKIYEIIADSLSLEERLATKTIPDEDH